MQLPQLCVESWGGCCQDDALSDAMMRAMRSASGSKLPLLAAGRAIALPATLLSMSIAMWANFSDPNVFCAAACFDKFLKGVWATGNLCSSLACNLISSYVVLGAADFSEDVPGLQYNRGCN